jgi:hypothetical protein
LVRKLIYLRRRRLSPRRDHRDKHAHNPALKATDTAASQQDDTGPSAIPALIPPSAMNSAPVEKLDSSLTRKTISGDLFRLAKA